MLANAFEVTERVIVAVVFVIVFAIADFEGFGKRALDLFIVTGTDLTV